MSWSENGGVLHRGTEAQRRTRRAKDVSRADRAADDPLTRSIIGCAIAVHRELGPGLLESAYEECLCYELGQHGLYHQRQVPLPVVYKSVRLDCGYRLDVVVERRVILESKTVECLLPIHDAQILTYLRLGGLPVGLLLHFHAVVMMQGIKRLSH